MNYGSQLKAWAIDRATALKCVNKEDGTVQDILDAAKKLVDFCYVADEEKEDLMKRLAQIEHDEKMAEAIAMKPASNAEAN